MLRGHKRILLSNLVLGGLVCLGSSGWAHAGGWEKHTKPEYTGEITTQADLEYPPDRTRKKLGLGEKATCSIDPTKFSDKDKCPGADPEIQEDGIGGVTWTTSGELKPLAGATGNSVTVEAKKKTSGNGKVEVAMDDKADKFDDTEQA